MLRIDPEQWMPQVLTLNEFIEQAVASGLLEEDYAGIPASTGPVWTDLFDVPIVTNARMFATDRTTHVGYLQTLHGVNNAHVNRHQSVAAFHPKADVPADLPPFRFYDLDKPPLT